ncbi:MAG: MarR family transcriptional regulator [Microbacterium sp.]|uniref:MarR family winged helix-turn-helix transcriptional regulator n=1 Tax=Microbacterium sp. TaxID=51671 RepID=UPI001DCD7B60|nr:MarR family transcriptional regulator [Microbacterium sp.]MBW8761349.1 MarR family transcriptional regulator [Microbacterium sp.]
MADGSARRSAAIARQGEAMQEFMARAVLFQDAVARSVGLNGTDLQAVGLLMSSGPTTPGELAARTGLTAGGAVTAMIDRLERAGYVTRTRDDADRRRVIVTADPEPVLAGVGPVYARVAQRWNEYLATLTDEQIEFAGDLLAEAAEINREQIEALRGTGRG